MSLTAYIRYDSKGRIVPSGPIVTKTKPTVGNWQVVTEGTSVTLVGQLRAFVKLNRYNKPLAGSLFLGKSKPATGKWLEVNATYSSNATPTYYLYAGNFCSSGDLTFVRSTVALSINDVIYLNDGNCCTIASVHEGPNYDVDYVSPAACFVAPCPTTTTTSTTATPVYTIGQQAQGGIIAYILQPSDPGYDANVQHGLVATINNVSIGATWGCDGTSISGADGILIGTGNQNTIDILAECGESGIAAMLCSDLSEGGYSDWYLPSKNELNTLYINRSTIGGFSNGFYHSSTQHNLASNWSQDFNDGAQYTFGKSNLFFVRAVRSF